MEVLRVVRVLHVLLPIIHHQPPTIINHHQPHHPPPSSAIITINHFTCFMDCATLWPSLAGRIPMANIPKIVLPHGGYKKLIVYRKSDLIYEGTAMFCRRFLAAHGDRTVDQMIQAARSCKRQHHFSCREYGWDGSAHILSRHSRRYTTQCHTQDGTRHNATHT